MLHNSSFSQFAAAGFSTAHFVPVAGFHRASPSTSLDKVLLYKVFGVALETSIWDYIFFVKRILKTFSRQIFINKLEKAFKRKRLAE